MARPRKNTQEIINQNSMSETTPHPFAEQIAKRTRDPQTGLLPNFNYSFDEFGRVDWEALIPTKYFYARKESFPDGTNLSEIDVSTLTPDKRVLNLDGVKFLMDLRGATNISIETVTSTPEHASVAVKIDWTPCIDQGMQPYSTIGICDAHAFNNVEPFKYVLASLSENKGISRATRTATRVKTYAADELRGSKDANKLDGESSSAASTGFLPVDKLREGMKKLGITFEQIKARYIKEGSDENATEDQKKWKERAESWKEDTDIAPIDIFSIITRLNKALGST